ncbi:hypothetical protein JY593_14400 [Staphylococcus aureus]|nr:hypothetical protein [Staphylococcus aureus]
MNIETIVNEFETRAGTLLENYYDIEWKRSVKYTENNVRWGFKKLKR